MVFSLLIIISTWNISGRTGLNLNQNYYNKEWQGGESSSISWVYDLNVLAGRKISEKLYFSNELKVNFGQTYLKERNTGEWLDPEKSSDKIENEAVMKVLLGWAIDPFLSARFRSQFVDNTYESLPRYIHPIELTQSIGGSRKLISGENKNLETRLGFALREILSRPVDTLTMTVNSIKSRIDGGLEWTTKSNFKFSNNLSYRGEVRVFKAFFNSESTEGENDWRMPDVNFYNILSISALNIVEMTLGIELIFEKEQTSNLQIKQNLTAGINIKF